jgi:hypothetical protein
MNNTHGGKRLEAANISDTAVFLTAVVLIMLVTLGTTKIVDHVKGPVVSACEITFKDFNGNKHMYIGKGEVI